MKKENEIVEEKIVVERYNPDPKVGLTTEQVEKHKQAGAVNIKVDSATQSIKEIIKEGVFTYFNLIFAILGILLAIVGSFRDMSFLLIILCNTGIGILQKIRSKKTLDKMAIVNTPHLKVIRDGKEETVDTNSLVLDDIVIFSAGNQIPADAKIISGRVAVNEALITGEADEVNKSSNDELYSGSFVISGRCVAKLEKVGKDSYISKLTSEATKLKNNEQSEMIKSLDKMVKVIGIIIVPIGVILFWQSYFISHLSMKQSVTSMVAAVIGMIPEGLYLLASVAMAVSAIRLAKQEVLLHDMKCIETLARVNVLCVDKTGTITVPEMEVSGFELVNNTSEETLRHLLSDFADNMDSDNITMIAIKDYFKESSGAKASKVFPFSSEYKYSGLIIDDENYILGAPEFVLREDYEKYAEDIEKYSVKGYRVLVFGEYKGVLTGKALEERVQPLAYVYLSNGIRKGAKETFEYFNDYGVEVKVISGDNPKTVSEIAKKAGIAKADKYIDASTLKSDEDLDKAIMEYTVFGRVTPEQKRKFVHALKAHALTVAMTGDGVNDVLALKDADCSIAMASGSEAAAQVSQLVLLDNDFSKMPSVVLEGRRVVNNIQRSASLYLVKNIFSMMLAIFSAVFMYNYPLEPSQVSLISVFTIGVPSFILALEPNKELIKGRFLTNVMVKALPASLTNFLVVSGLLIFCREFGVTDECISTSVTILVAIVGFMILYRISLPMNKVHISMLVCLIAGWLYCMLFVSHLFAITSITKQCAMLMIVFALITEPCLRYLAMMIEAIQNGVEKIKTRKELKHSK